MILFLAACVATGGLQNTYNRSNLSQYPIAYREVLRTWDGASLNDLMIRWGEPDKIFELPNGNKVYEYTTDYIETSSSRFSETTLGYFSSSQICISRFEIKDLTVVRTDAWGDYCSHWREPQIPIIKANDSATQNTYIQ